MTVATVLVSGVGQGESLDEHSRADTGGAKGPGRDLRATMN